jgi:hypothetical protein
LGAWASASLHVNTSLTSLHGSPPVPTFPFTVFPPCHVRSVCSHTNVVSPPPPPPPPPPLATTHSSPRPRPSFSGGGTRESKKSARRRAQSTTPTTPTAAAVVAVPGPSYVAVSAGAGPAIATAVEPGEPARLSQHARRGGGSGGARSRVAPPRVPRPRPCRPLPAAAAAAAETVGPRHPRTPTSSTSSRAATREAVGMVGEAAAVVQLRPSARLAVRIPMVLAQVPRTGEGEGPCRSRRTNRSHSVRAHSASLSRYVKSLRP